MSAVLLLSYSLFTPANLASAEESSGVTDVDEIADIISSSLEQDENGNLIFDEDNAIENGLSNDQASNVKTNLEELNSMLAAAGAGWLVKEILDNGIASACEKFGNSSKAPKVFKNYCERKGHI